MAIRLPVDQTMIEQDYVRGIVRDAAEIPTGGLYECIDFLVEQPGMLYKRGGWSRHSLSISGSYAKWVGTIHLPTRVAAINSSNTLYDVTSENAPQATSIGSVGFAPTENSPQYIDRLILCDPTAAVAPKTVRYDSGPDSLVIENLGGSPPAAMRSTVYAGRIVLARGATYALTNRVWFSQLPNAVSATWDTTNMFFDATHEISGLGAIGGVLLIFSPTHVERVLGGQPPGTVDSDMELQPLAGVGCVDARSIVTWDEMIIFAGEEGVWITNGSNVESITEKPDGTGIQSYWRSLFPRARVPAGTHNGRQLVAGLINRDFYIISVLDENNVCQVTLLCHLPSRAWTKVSNVNPLSMAQGRTEEEILELYYADSTTPYVEKLGGILFPAINNTFDGNGTQVQPTMTSRGIGGGPSLKAYGYGRLSYNLYTGGVSAWQALHAYAQYDIVLVGEKLFYASTAGTSGSSIPNFGGSAGYGSTVSDGSVVWTDVAPGLQISKVTQLGQETTTSITTLVNRATDQFVARGRFQLFGDYQDLAVKIAQQGISVETQIYFMEVEARAYATAADFNSALT